MAIQSKKSIFEYDNYRDYLGDFYALSKKENPRFSFRFFSKLAGFKSQSVLKLVMEGQRNIAEQSIDKFAKALKLNKEESAFFRSLVLFNQATDQTEKQEHAMEMIRSRKFKMIHPMKDAQFQFYSKWYLTPLREVVTLIDFKEDPEWIAQKISPAITAVEAKRGIEELLKLNLLERDSEGRLKQTESLISTADEVMSVAVTQFHKQMLSLAGESIERVPRDQRDISAQTIGVSAQTAKKIKEMIQNFRKEIMEVVYHERDVEMIYQLNFQLFPLTSQPERKKS